MKEDIVIYAQYEEQINMLSDGQAGVLFRAILRYQNGAELPAMDDVTAMAFAFIKQQIDIEKQKREEICKINKNNGRLGGRPSKSLINKGDKPKKPNGYFGFSEKPNGFENNRTVCEETERFSKETTSPQKESSKEKYTPLVQENPPFYSPHGEEEKTAEAVFFEKYPKYAKDRAKARKDFDYKRLLEEFEKSTYLRSLYTFKQVTELYPLIVTGEFRDKEKSVPKDERTEAINAKAKRDRWYETRRANAELQAEYIHDRFMKDEEFRRIERRLSAMESELARAEIGAENGEAKAQKELVKLTQEQGRLRQQRLGIIERNGLTEEDLLPKWHCRKCSDTGYLSDGRACDCYLKEQEGG